MSRFDYIKYDMYSVEMQGKFKEQFVEFERVLLNGAFESARSMLASIQVDCRQKQLDGRGMTLALEYLDYVSTNIVERKTKFADDDSILEEVIIDTEIAYMWIGKGIRDWQLKRDTKGSVEQPERADG